MLNSCRPCWIALALRHCRIGPRAPRAGRSAHVTGCRARCIAITADRRSRRSSTTRSKASCPAMTMPYKVREQRGVDAARARRRHRRHAGRRRERRLPDERQEGRQAPLEKAPAERPAASSGIRAAEARQAVPEPLPQSGRQKKTVPLVRGRPSSSRSSTPSVRCRRSAPLMDRHFVDAPGAAQSRSALRTCTW